MEGKVLLVVLVTAQVTSGLNWPYRNNGFEYHVSSSSRSLYLSWYDAREKCMEDGGDLLTIETDAEDKWIISNIRPHSSLVWMGLNKFSGVWQWADGKSSSVDNWYTNEPKPGNLCAYKGYPYSKNWYSQNCGDIEAYMCKRPSGLSTHTPKTPLTTPIVGGYCPAGFVGAANSNRCYKFFGPFTKQLDWDDAQKLCQNLPYNGGELAAATTTQEVLLLTMLTIGYKTTDEFHIGIYRKYYSNEEWKWTDNSEAVLTNWDDSYRDYSDGCGSISTGSKPPGRWTVNNDCIYDREGYVCQVLKDPLNVISTQAPTQPHDCGPGYYPYNQGCYKVIKTASTWQKAKDACNAEGTFLVDMHSNEEASAVYYLLSSENVEAAWTGLYYAEDTKQYKWSNKWYVTFTRWGLSQPKRKDGGGCVAVHRENGEWYDHVCTEALPVVCKKTSAPAITHPPEKPGRCLNKEWMAIGGHCYYARTGNYGLDASWASQVVECKKLHPMATIASVHDYATNDQLIKSMLEKDSSADGWLGIYRSSQDQTWKWADQTPVEFTNWQPGHPNPDPGTSYDCAYMYGRSTPPGQWLSSYCSSYHGRLCKMEKLEEVSTPTPVNGSCPGPMWELYGDMCYLFLPQELGDWNMGMQHCIKEGGGKGQLAVINSWPVNDYIHGRMVAENHLPNPMDYWIGLARKDVSSSFVWIDGRNASAGYTAWESDEPSSGSDSNCVQANMDSSEWENVPCDSYQGYVCQAPIKPYFTTTPGPNDRTTQGAAGNGNTGLPGGAVAGIVIGVLIIAMILGAIGFIVFKSMKGDPVLIVTKPAGSGFANPSLDRVTADMTA